MLLKISGLQVHISGLHILQDIGLQVAPGELVAIVGANGAGKSTLLRTIAGLEKTSAGSIQFAGKDIHQLPPAKISETGVCMVPEGKQLFYEMSVYENLKMGAYTYRSDKARIAKNVERMYELFPVLKDYQNRVAGTLSGGEQQMLTIARGLMSEPKLLMIDELSLGLAPKIIDMLLKIIKQLNEQGMSILLVEQNVRQALRIADRGYVIENGKLTISGSGQELLDNDYIKVAYLGL